MVGLDASFCFSDFGFYMQTRPRRSGDLATCDFDLAGWNREYLREGQAQTLELELELEWKDITVSGVRHFIEPRFYDTHHTIQTTDRVVDCLDVLRSTRIENHTFYKST